MVAKSKLKAALDAHKGKDYKLEKQKQLQKRAAKAKKAKAQSEPENETIGHSQEEDDASDYEEGGVSLRQQLEDIASAIDTSHIDDSLSESESEVGDAPAPPPDDDAQWEDEDEGDDEDIPLSDIESLASDERGDLLPHQRLTINNTSALLKSLSSIALPISTLPFVEHQSLTTTTLVSIPDINDDLSRELAFYKQCLDAAVEGRARLRKEGVPFSRPTDYFAEMVKSDEHMGKIKQKLVEDAAGKKAAAEARKQRDLKKFGKQVQVAKLQERDKAKRDTLEKIQVLKRKRQGAGLGAGEAEEEDLFDVALEDATKSDRRDRSSSSRGGGRGGKPGFNDRGKRQKRDEKFGFGGKKRFSKSGDAASSADLSGFSPGRMKGRGGGSSGRGGRGGRGRGSQRLGKDRRAARQH